jgi:16S rRNA (guanine527-N7)-methyltransferase
VNINCYNKLKNGILYLKGGDLGEELKELGKRQEHSNYTNTSQKSF